MSRLTVVSGPSGVGKSTVVAEVLRRDPAMWLSVSVTTRAPRPGEEDGIDYYFVSGERFAELVATGELLESAEFAGNWYGTPKAPVMERLSAGSPVLLEIDLAGARQVRRSMPEALLVFIAPPSWDVLEQRLTARGTEDDQAIRTRLETARLELAAADEFDATVVNTSVQQAAEELLSLATSSDPEQKRQST